jgi:hypothetical protein
MVAEMFSVVPMPAVAVMAIVVVMTVMVVYVEVSEDEETGEPETAPPPERIRHPGIEIGIIRRRRVVGDYRRPFIIIIVVYGRRVRVFCSGGYPGTARRRIRRDRQTIPAQDALKRFQCLVTPHRYLARLCRFAHRDL